MKMKEDWNTVIELFIMRLLRRREKRASEANCLPSVFGG